MRARRDRVRLHRRNLSLSWARRALSATTREQSQTRARMSALHLPRLRGLEQCERDLGEGA